MAELNWQKVLKAAEAIVRDVGEGLLVKVSQAQATEKADGSLVTEADRWADHVLREAIAAQFPTHGLLTEETETAFPENDWCWVVDPIDGTTNFARGIPIWGISLGLLYLGTPVFGCVYIPPLDQLFRGYWAGDTGLNMPQGAYMNDQLIHVSQEALTPNHLFSFCTRSIAALQIPPASTQKFPCKIRMLGVASYNLLTVAMGWVLGAAEATPKVWDIAGAWPILHAAGAEWLPLNPSQIFPLVAGQDYHQQSYPSLVLSQASLVPVFKPLVAAKLGGQ